MQAVSGAGYPGVPSLDILGNVIPYIKDEEPKIEQEIQKFLGTPTDDVVHSADFPVSAHANRVPVEHGHTVCMSIGLATKRERRRRASAPIAEWRGAEVGATASERARARAASSRREPDRPQPRRQVDTGNGMTVVVGRVRPDPIFDVKLVAMGHNVIRGAAGASVLNAELMVHCGLHRRLVIVLKFGGTSVGDAEAIARTGRIVATRVDRGPDRRRLGARRRDERADRASPSRRRRAISSARFAPSKACASGTSSRPKLLLGTDARVRRRSAPS